MSFTIVGEQISKFRKKKGLTQKELGEAIGVSSSAVSQWESGGTPDISLLPALSDILGVTVDALFGRSEALREDMEETVGKYIASLPEEKRIGRLISLMRGAMLSGCVDRVADVVDFDGNDSEMICMARDGFATAIISERQSFLSAAWREEGVFADLLPWGEAVLPLFSALSSPHGLAVFLKLCSEAPKYRSVGVLAKLARAAQGETEEILQKFTELKLTEEMEIETENGSEKVYAVNLNGAAMSLLVSARFAVGKPAAIRISADKREYGSGRDSV